MLINRLILFLGWLCVIPAGLGIAASSNSPDGSPAWYFWAGAIPAAGAYLYALYLSFRAREGGYFGGVFWFPLIALPIQALFGPAGQSARDKLSAQPYTPLHPSGSIVRPEAAAPTPTADPDSTLSTPTAKFCSNCGHELRKGEKFCAECGTPVGGQMLPQAAPIDYEYCEITFTVAGMLQGACYFWAKGIGAQGVHEVARSQTKFGAAGTDSSGFGGYYLPDPPDAKTKRALDEVIQTLVGSGWEPMSDRGSDWYSYKFRRPVKS